MTVWGPVNSHQVLDPFHIGQLSIMVWDPVNSHQVLDFIFTVDQTNTLRGQAKNAPDPGQIILDLAKQAPFETWSKRTGSWTSTLLCAFPAAPSKP